MQLGTAVDVCTEDSLYVKALGAARSHVSDPRRLQRPRIRFPEVADDVAVSVGLLSRQQRGAISASIMQLDPSQGVRTATRRAA